MSFNNTQQKNSIQDTKENSRKTNLEIQCGSDEFYNHLNSNWRYMLNTTLYELAKSMFCLSPHISLTFYEEEFKECLFGTICMPKKFKNDFIVFVKEYNKSLIMPCNIYYKLYSEHVNIYRYSVQIGLKQ